MPYSQDVHARRLATIFSHLATSACAATDVGDDAATKEQLMKEQLQLLNEEREAMGLDPINGPILPTPVVMGTPLLSSNPLEFLMAAYEKNPDLFMVDRSRNNKYVVIGDVDLFDEVLSDETVRALDC
jgi:hypothetical protein